MTTPRPAPEVQEPRVALNLADLARARGFWYEAEYRYGRAVEEAPDDGRARFYHGWALANRGRYAEAAPEYARAAALGNDPAFAYYQAARSLVRADQVDETFEALRSAVNAGFSHFERLHYEGVFRSLHGDPRWQALIPPFEAEFAGPFATFQEDAASAVTALADLARRYPQEGRARYYCGRSAKAAGRHDEAVHHLVAAADLGFEPAYALYYAAQAAAALGDRSRAWDLLGRSLELGFFEWGTLADDEELADLRGEPAWRTMMEGLGLGAAPPLDDSEWPERPASSPFDTAAVRPADAGLDPDILAAGRRYLRATRPRTNSVIIIHRGRIVHEWYFNGFGPEVPTNVKSVSKAIVSAAVGAALEDGAISSLDQPIAEILPEYFAQLEDPRKQKITVRHLLNMTSGLEFDEGGAVIRHWLRSHDWVRFYLGLNLVAEPGERWEYSTASTHLLGTAVARAVGEPLGAYIDRRILGPVGVRNAGWSYDPLGRTFAGSDLYLVPRDLARFGLVYLHGGVAEDGHRVLTESWIRASTASQASDGTDGPDVQDYGFAWWHWSAGRYRSFMAAGHGGNYINVTPELDLVVVTTADVHRGFTPTISEFIQAYVIRAIDTGATRRPGSR